MKSDIHTSLSIKSNSCLFAACLFFWIKHGVLWQTHETLIADQSRMADFFFVCCWQGSAVYIVSVL